MRQTQPPDVIVVGDDGSQAEVREICDAYRDSRIRYFARSPKVKMTENWDFVLRWSPDGIVALLEDDNFWYPDHLRRAVLLLSRFPAAGLYHAGHQEAWDRGQGLDMYKTFFPPWHNALIPPHGGVVDPAEIVLDALVCGSINSSTVVLRRAVLETVPTFDSRYLMGMDTLMWTRIAMRWTCVYHPSLDAVYTYHQNNVSRGEILSRRAGSQARASRRLIAHEALSCGLIDIPAVRARLQSLPPSDAAAMITMLAHSSTDAPLRAVALDVWRQRSDLRDTTGFMKASRVLGFGVLGQADRIDRAMSALAYPRPSGLAR